MAKKLIALPDAVIIMLRRDSFSKWLGLTIEECAKGHCILHFRVTTKMTNGFQIVHGGILFSASDSAFAFACNGHGWVTVALEANISFARPVKTGELLRIEARELYHGNRIGIYDVRTTNQKGELICIFKGTAYRTSKAIG